jgi:hypothetical protein
MSSYDNWDDERGRLLNLVDERERDRVSGLLDRAARSARTNDLREAADSLEETRRVLVGHHLFQRWDNGILVFSSLIRLIRAMSAETTVPRDYERFLDAIPSARYDSSMSRAQTKFWYGPVPPAASSGSQVGAREGAEPTGAGFVFLGGAILLIGVAIVAYWLFW